MGLAPEINSLSCSSHKPRAELENRKVGATEEEERQPDSARGERGPVFGPPFPKSPAAAKMAKPQAKGCCNGAQH